MGLTIETERLILREFVQADAEALHTLNSDPEVMKFTGDKPFISVMEAREFLDSYNSYALHGYGRWAVILKENGLFIGWCGLKYHNEGFTDLGFRFMKEHWNQGYATEAARACLGHAFGALGLDEVIGRVARANHRSVRVLEKLQMHFWKEAPCEVIARAIYYRITPSVFRNTHRAE
jgi:ribosomal-protein-alanine N-acetyltransferase